VRARQSTPVRERCDDALDTFRILFASMHIILNGDRLSLPSAMRVTELLQHLGLGERRIAVEVNRAIVPRSQHAEHLLQDGDAVELVHALGGG
jgi:sulfur carrier protein